MNVQATADLKLCNSKMPRRGPVSQRRHHISPSFVGSVRTSHTYNNNDIISNISDWPTCEYSDAIMQG